MNTPNDTKISPQRRRDLVVAGACAAFAISMVGAAYAAVPFYTWFCRTTGFGGTPQVASAGPVQVLDRKVTVRFDTNISGLPWRFEPERTSIEVRIGEVVTVNFVAENNSDEVTVGQAGFNVIPPTVGAYFTKINCFCFTQQKLKPHEKREMPVVFFVDPDLVKNSEQNDLNTITLSYTMFPVRQPAQPVVETAPANPSGRT